MDGGKSDAKGGVNAGDVETVRVKSWGAFPFTKVQVWDTSNQSSCRLGHLQFAMLSRQAAGRRHYDIPMRGSEIQNEQYATEFLVVKVPLTASWFSVVTFLDEMFLVPEETSVVLTHHLLVDKVHQKGSVCQKSRFVDETWPKKVSSKPKPYEPIRSYILYSFVLSVPP